MLVFSVSMMFIVALAGQTTTPRPGDLPPGSRAVYDEMRKKVVARDTEGALVLAEKLAAREPMLAWVQHTAASGAILCEKYELAIRYCDRALKLNPKLDAAWNVRANSNARLGRYSDAEQDFTKELEIDPKAYDALHARAFCRREQGKLKDALTDIAEVCKVRNDENAMSGHVALLLENLMLEEAQREADKLLIAHLTPNARLARGTVLLARSKDKEAEAEFAKALEAAPQLKDLIEMNRAAALDLKARALAQRKNPSSHTPPVRP